MKLMAGMLLFVLESVTGNTDWRSEGWLSVPYDQMGCGGCYGFAATTILESFTSQITGKPISFSPQFYVDCFEGNGCAGGSLKQTLQYVEEHQYQAYFEDYGFTGYYDPSNCVNGGFKNRTARNAMADVWLLKYSKIGATQEDLKRALDRGPTAHDMLVSSDVFNWNDKGHTSPIVDSMCVFDPNPHSWSFVGYTDDAYIIKGSYGNRWVGDGFALYSKENINCNYYNKAYTVYMAKRREVEYKIGKGVLKFEAAEEACEELGAGWTLAIIPTRMHVYQVYDMFTAKYGTDYKNKDAFNYFWIGINQATAPTDAMKWIDNETPVTFSWFGSKPSKKFVKMAKFNKSPNAQYRGKWYSESKMALMRYMCSRFRSETCPRISQTAVDDSYKVTFTNHEEEETLEIVAGTRASFICMPGYSLDGPTESYCQTNGQWSNFPKCVQERTKCPPLVIANSRYIKINGKILGKDEESSEGAKATVACMRTYWKSTSGVIKCTNGEWSNVPTCDQRKKKRT